MSRTTDGCLGSSQHRLGCWPGRIERTPLFRTFPGLCFSPGWTGGEAGGEERNCSRCYLVSLSCHVSVLWSSACRIHTPGVLAPGGEAPRVQKAIPVAFVEKLHRGGAARPSQPCTQTPGRGARGADGGGKGAHSSGLWSQEHEGRKPWRCERTKRRGTRSGRKRVVGRSASRWNRTSASLRRDP